MSPLEPAPIQCECRGGPPCACPDCDHPDCLYRGENTDPPSRFGYIGEAEERELAQAEANRRGAGPNSLDRAMFDASRAAMAEECRALIEFAAAMSDTIEGEDNKLLWRRRAGRLRAIARLLKEVATT